MLHTICFPRRLVFMVLMLAGSNQVNAAIIHPQVDFVTSGTIDPSGRTGVAAVRFISSAGITDASSPFSLGAFVIEPPSDGTMTRYDRTPVLISYATRAIDGTSTAGADGMPAQPLALRGWLSGTVGGGEPGHIWLSLDQGVQPTDPNYYQPRLLPPFPAGSSLGVGSPGTLSLMGGKSVIELNLFGGSTPIEAQINLAPNVPEPASYLVFLGVVAGCIYKRRRSIVG